MCTLINTKDTNMSMPTLDNPSSVDIFKNIGDPQRVDHEKLEGIRQRHMQHIPLGSNLENTFQIPTEDTHPNPQIPVDSDVPSQAYGEAPPPLATEPPEVPGFDGSQVPESFVPNEPCVNDSPQAWSPEGERSPYLPRERNELPSPPREQAPFQNDPTLESMRKDYSYRSSTRWQPGRSLRDDPDYAEKQELLARIDELKAMGYNMPPMDYSVDVADMQAAISRRVVSMSTISTVDMIIHWIRQAANFAQMVFGFILPETYAKDVEEGSKTPQFRYAIYQLVVRYQTGKNSGPWRIILMVLVAPIIQGIITKVAQLFTGGNFKVPAGIIPGILKKFMPKPENVVDGINTPESPTKPHPPQNPFSRPRQQQQRPPEAPPPPKTPPGVKAKKRLKRPSEINSNIITESQLDAM